MAFASANIAYGDFSLPRTAAGDATTGGVSGVNKLWLPLHSLSIMLQKSADFIPIESFKYSKNKKGSIIIKFLNIFINNLFLNLYLISINLIE